MKYYILQLDMEWNDNNKNTFLALQVDPGKEDRPYFGFMMPKSKLVALTYDEAKELYENTKNDSDESYIIPEDELQLFLAEHKLRKT